MILSGKTPSQCLQSELQADERLYGAVMQIARDLAALMRRVAGVRRIVEVSLQVDRGSVTELQLKPTELPRLDLDASDIKVVRPTGGVA